MAVIVDKKIEGKEGENGEPLIEKKLEYEDLEIKFNDQNNCELFIQAFKNVI